MARIAISTECVSDIPRDILKERNISLVYFDIETNRGMFRDTVEIDDKNIINYMRGGYNKAASVAPLPSAYASHFEKLLKDYDEVIHISISTKVSLGYKNASIGRTKIGMEGDRVHVIDSQSLSGGQSLLVLMAQDMVDAGWEAVDIVREIELKRSKLVTTFMTDTLEYLYYNGRVSKKAYNLCKKFRVHAVLEMKDGVLSLSRVLIGSYNNCGRRYLKWLLSRRDYIQTNRGFFVNAGCSMDTKQRIQKQIEHAISFDEFIVNAASATVSCNCGPGAFGLMFIKK